jgi:hypothetical protein
MSALSSSHWTARRVGSYRRLRALVIVPAETENHGIATSLYYRDPDHNRSSSRR